MATLSRPFTVKEIVGSSERDLRVECYCKPMEEGLVNFIQQTVRYFRNSSRIARQEYFRVVLFSLLLQRLALEISADCCFSSRQHVVPCPRNAGDCFDQHDKT
jgi:hypothetical protein